MKQVENTALPEAEGAHYTYNPTACQDKGVNQMRLELGDTTVQGQSKTAMLCDEEYTALLSGEKSWKRAKLNCVEAILMKLSYEVDTSVGGLSYSLSDRADRWRQMRDQLKKELSGGLPAGDPKALTGGAYFYPDMLSNRRKGPTTECH